jgi:hypothetical protein
VCLTIEVAERALVIYIGQATKENFRVGLGRARCVTFRKVAAARRSPLKHSRSVQ